LGWWAYFNKVKLDFSRPGKPTDNAFIESFNGKFRQECLNQHWFLLLDDASEVINTWQDDYTSTDRTARLATDHQFKPPRLVGCATLRKTTNQET
jgi:transposase InsO family protein